MKFNKLIMIVLFTIFISGLQPIGVHANERRTKEINEVFTLDQFTKSWIVYDEAGDVHVLVMDHKNMELLIVDEVVKVELEYPTTKATIDASSGITLTSSIPWKGSVTLLSASIAAILGGAPVTGWPTTIVSALTADASAIYLLYTQYKSKELYYSYYHGINYNKYTIRNISFRQNSSVGKLLLGPADGGWLDPIRVY